jgi:hypothetical protein
VSLRDSGVLTISAKRNAALGQCRCQITSLAPPKL